jgi:hypothetical protein
VNMVSEDLNRLSLERLPLVGRFSIDLKFTLLSNFVVPFEFSRFQLEKSSLWAVGVMF